MKYSTDSSLRSAVHQMSSMQASSWAASRGRGLKEWPKEGSGRRAVECGSQQSSSMKAAASGSRRLRWMRYSCASAASRMRSSVAGSEEEGRSCPVSVCIAHHLPSGSPGSTAQLRSAQTPARGSSAPTPKAPCPQPQTHCSSFIIKINNPCQITETTHTPHPTAHAPIHQSRHSQQHSPCQPQTNSEASYLFVVEDVDESSSTDERVDVSIEGECAAGVHESAKQCVKPSPLEPIREKVVGAEGKLSDVVVEEDGVDGDGGLAVGPCPLVRDHVDEVAAAARGQRVVLDHLDPHRRLRVHRQQRNSHRQKVSLPPEQPRTETVLSERQLQDRVLVVSVVVVVRQWLIECQQVVLLRDYLQEGEQVVTGSLERDPEVLQEVPGSVLGRAPGAQSSVDAVGVVVVLEVEVEVVDGGEVADEVEDAEAVDADLLVLVVEQFVLDDLVDRRLVLPRQQAHLELHHQLPHVPQQRLLAHHTAHPVTVLDPLGSSSGRRVVYTREDGVEEVDRLLLETEVLPHGLLGELDVEVDGLAGVGGRDGDAEQVVADVVEEDKALLAQKLDGEGSEQARRVRQDGETTALPESEERPDVALQALLALQLLMQHLVGHAVLLVDLAQQLLHRLLAHPHPLALPAAAALQLQTPHALLLLPPQQTRTHLPLPHCESLLSNDLDGLVVGVGGGDVVVRGVVVDGLLVDGDLGD